MDREYEGQEHGGKMGDKSDRETVGSCCEKGGDQRERRVMERSQYCLLVPTSSRNYYSQSPTRSNVPKQPLLITMQTEMLPS